MHSFDESKLRLLVTYQYYKIYLIYIIYYVLYAFVVIYSVADIVTTCHWMTTELFGGSGVHRVLYYNCSSLSPAGNGSSWLTMPSCLAAIWAGTGHWPA